MTKNYIYLIKKLYLQKKVIKDLNKSLKVFKTLDII